jgi:hypothetical protein
MGVTSRQSIPYPEPTDPANGPAAFRALAEAADLSSFALQGSLSARPAAGMQGRFYWATDVTTFYYDTGAQWVTINPAGVVDGPAGTPSLRTLGTGTLQAASGNDSRLSDQRVPTDGSVTATKIANALKPSAGAGGSTEALRALGTSAGTAAPGTHASQHGLSGSDPVAINWAQMVGTPFTWNDVTFLNGWTSWSAGYQTVQYAKDPFGMVHLRGVAGYGTSTLAFTLPAGYRPAKNEIFPPNPSKDGDSFGFTVFSTGNVSSAIPAGGAGNPISFSGIRFMAA